MPASPSAPRESPPIAYTSAIRESCVCIRIRIRIPQDLKSATPSWLRRPAAAGRVVSRRRLVGRARIRAAPRLASLHGLTDAHLPATWPPGPGRRRKQGRHGGVDRFHFFTQPVNIVQSHNPPFPSPHDYMRM
jgi:hypothetical protein